jgi:branched-chain amino acid transport system substrate-binding protein
MKMKLKSIMAAVAFLAASQLASAQIKIGVVVSATGPASSLGIPEKNTVALLPTKIGNETVTYIVLDDASDTTTAVKNTRKLVSEDNVDVIVGSTVTPNSLAMIDIAAESKTPMVSMAASSRIVQPMDAKKAWVFKTPQDDIMMATAIASHMSNTGVKKVAFIGFSDAYGEGWYNEFSKIASIYGLTVVANERFARSDTSVTGQALKIVAAKPDAVLVAGSGTPAALPQKALKERGFTGKMYQTHGVANNDFLRVCGKDCEGTFLPSGPMLVAKQLPASHPVKKSALEYVTKYEAQYGAGSVSTFGGHAWDAFQLVNAAATKALKKAKPGTPEFRAALREALEGTTNLPGAHGIFSMTKTDHLGLDQRAREMVQIVDGTWKWAPAK